MSKQDLQFSAWIDGGFHATCANKIFDDGMNVAYDVFEDGEIIATFENHNGRPVQVNGEEFTEIFGSSVENEDECQHLYIWSVPGNYSICQRSV
jgi:hypothetical protein